MLRAISIPVFLFSLFFALVASIGLFPADWALWRPEWVGLIVFYWVFRAPYLFGIFFAASMGLLLDVLEGRILGVNMLALAVMAFLVLTAHQRLRMYPLPQQGVMVFLLLGISQMLVHFIGQMLGEGQPGYSYLLPAVVSGLVWMPLAPLLDLLNTRLR